MSLRMDQKPILQKISHPEWDVAGVQLWIKREDLIHPTISGNKWRKLKYNLAEAKQAGFDQIVTFGGAFSNHIYATAAAGREAGFRTVGIIRGEPVSNPTLDFAKSQGMQLHFVSREAYRAKAESDEIKKLLDTLDPYYLIPEGGSNAAAVKGCIEIVQELPHDLNYVATCCGTGGTLAGIALGISGDTQAIGFSALKGDFLVQEVKSLIAKVGQIDPQNWQINVDYHFGGYAKFKPELIDFINAFKQETDIQLDPIYTGKMMYGLFDLLKQGYFRRGDQVCAIHTGGLQGIAGFNAQYGHLINVS
ncbi:1-aminocyclopropane-1-carboxylate deaminase/D-cysteine desulfhydrase [Penaeicola halotolerans]|uniref:1-aminocyclopropane-1-carboxylate deaminase/D-cysteine desulfhydrase n=1 Tax=Penaeicola halotolerans TaxID=2793196 RepID=UPI001CF858BB|nr:pyridoxal-phosphate dependent enzyme [Penaeicola halotolerans]